MNNQNLGSTLCPEPASTVPDNFIFSSLFSVAVSSRPLSIRSLKRRKRV